MFDATIFKFVKAINQMQNYKYILIKLLRKPGNLSGFFV